MKYRISAHIALYILLATAVILTIIPFLGSNPPSVFETDIITLAKSMKDSSIASIFSTSSHSDIITQTYAYIVKLFINLWDFNELFLVRLPSAIVVIILTSALFRFDRSSDKLNKSFLASMLFITCGYICNMAYNSALISIPALFFILSLVSLYHWLRVQSRTNFMIMVAVCGITTIFLGIIELTFVALVGLVFISTKSRNTLKNYILFTLAILTSAVFCFLLVYSITGDRDVATNIFSTSNVLTSLSEPDTSTIYIFTSYIIFAVFPWSIPLIVSCWWLFRHPRWVIDHFITLTLLQRFGIVVFLLSIPLFFFFTPISLVVLTASIFFNLPLVGNYLLSRYDAHPKEWKITGALCAPIIIISAVIFSILNSGVVIQLGSFSIALQDYGWTIGNIIIMSAIVVNLYTLWRNTRSLYTSHRFLYNIILLYILSQTLYMGYINDRIILSIDSILL